HDRIAVGTSAARNRDVHDAVDRVPDQIVAGQRVHVDRIALSSPDAVADGVRKLHELRAANRVDTGRVVAALNCEGVGVWSVQQLCRRLERDVDLPRDARLVLRLCLENAWLLLRYR